MPSTGNSCADSADSDAASRTISLLWQQVEVAEGVSVYVESVLGAVGIYGDT